jgi:hypothetical protein
MIFPRNGLICCRYVVFLVWDSTLHLFPISVLRRKLDFLLHGSLASQELVARLGDENYQVINGVLEVCNVLFKRYVLFRARCAVPTERAFVTMSSTT